MGSLNKIELIGNLGKTPDVKTLENGVKVASFTLATTEPAYTTPQGKQVAAKTEWHNIVAWGGMATIAERYLAKGQQVYVEGKMRYRSYEDNNTHQKRYVAEVVCTNIVLLSSNNGNNNAAGKENAASQADTAPTAQFAGQDGQMYYQQPEMPTGASYGGQGQDNDPFPF